MTFFSVPRVPAVMEKIEHKFIISNTNNITACIKWKPPESDAPITGYRFIWGLKVDSHDASASSTTPIMDQNTALQKVLQDNVSVLFLLQFCYEPHLANMLVSIKMQHSILNKKMTSMLLDLSQHD